MCKPRQWCILSISNHLWSTRCAARPRISARVCLGPDGSSSTGSRGRRSWFLLLGLPLEQARVGFKRLLPQRLDILAPNPPMTCPLGFADLGSGSASWQYAGPKPRAYGGFVDTQHVRNLLGSKLVWRDLLAHYVDLSNNITDKSPFSTYCLFCASRSPAMPARWRHSATDQLERLLSSDKEVWSKHRSLSKSPFCE